MGEAVSSNDAPVHCECGETTDLLHDCDRKEREAEERRKRYEAAMIAAEHEAASPLMMYKAGAAVAMADKEIQGGIDVMRQKVDRARSESARLREKYDERGEMLTSLEVKLRKAVKERDDLSRALQRIDRNIRNGGASDSALVLAIWDIVKEAQR